MKSGKILCFGEVLWDVLPKGIFLGGAPFNVCYHLNQLGVKGDLISSVGDDFLGREILKRMQSWEIETGYTLIHPTKETGNVQVEFNSKGEPNYSITEDVAWDYIQIDKDFEEWDSIIFGSLSLRSEQNLRVINDLIESVPRRIFDVNLRFPYVNKELILKLMEKSTLVKMNEDELNYLFGASGMGSDEVISKVRSLYPEISLCVTQGEKGALFVNRDGDILTCKAQKINAADPVGAGDAFLATLVKGLYIEELDPKISLEMACLVGGWVASKEGATPAYDHTFPSL